MTKQLSPQINESLRKSLKRLVKRMPAKENRLSRYLDQGTVAVVTEQSKQVASLPADMRKRIKGMLRSGDGGVICKPGVDTGSVHFDYVVVSEEAMKTDLRLDLALHHAGRLVEIMQSPETLTSGTIEALQTAPSGPGHVEIEGLTNIDVDLEIKNLAEELKDLQLTLPDLCGGGVHVPPADLGIIRKLNAGEINFLLPLYGDGINYDRIRLSPLSGLGGAPFTVHISPGMIPEDLIGVDLDLPLLEFGFTIINVGRDLYPNTLVPFTTSSGATFGAGSVLAHEVAHSWQSQHHTDGSLFMWNSVLSQAMALAVYQDSSAAYTYRPGEKLRKYAAEQAATNVSVFLRASVSVAGESDIVAKMRNASTNLPNADNMIGMLVPRVADPANTSNRNLAQAL